MITSNVSYRTVKNVFNERTINHQMNKSNKRKSNIKIPECTSITYYEVNVDIAC